MQSLFSKIALACLGIVFLFSCTKEDLVGIPTFEAYTWAGTDAAGGNWKPVLLASADMIPVAAPELTGSANYLAELATTKTAASNLTAAEQEEIAYWGASSVTRWNEIARDLAAKHNLVPSANPDGTYPIATATDPTAYPGFPVSTPPYAARAFAYLSTATFDAMIACWHYKAEFNRNAPYQVDSTITTLLPQQNIASYPSEDAVAGAVAYTILAKLFPLEQAYLLEKFQSLQNARINAGMNVQSDLIAGDSLGRQVARVFLGRAATDGMGTAGNGAILDSLKLAAETQFGWDAWHSLDTPVRPALLPAFGKVKPWCYASIATVRPGPPPAPGSAEHAASLAALHGWTENPTKESRQIANFWADGGGTYTPPGHWNRLACDQIHDAAMNPLRAARVLAYLNMAVVDAGISCWDTKYTYMTPRPSQDDPTLKTLLGVPNFPGYSSGHSTFSGAAAAVLGHIFPSNKSIFDNWAKEASLSRVYGGIHHTYDCEVGLATGYTIGNASVSIAMLDGAE
jgi:PAP2 superfamily